MGKRDDALRALHGRDWSGGEVDPGERPTSFVYSVRLPGDLADRFADEATRTGLTPSALLRQMVEARLAGVDEGDEPVSVRPSELHSLVDKLLKGRRKVA